MPRRFAWLTYALVSAFSLACARSPGSSPAPVAPEPGVAAGPPSTEVVPENAVPRCPPVEPSAAGPIAAPSVDPPGHDMARVLREANTPPELVERGAAAHVWDEHEIDHSINPFYLRGDFDGDGRPDYLVSVLRKDAPAGPPDPRLVVLRGITGKDAAVWLVDDAELSTPARDGWYVHAEHTKVPVGFDGSKAPRLVGDAIVMMKAESSSALIYWTGKRFASHWLSD